MSPNSDWFLICLEEGVITLDLFSHTRILTNYGSASKHPSAARNLQPERPGELQIIVNEVSQNSCFGAVTNSDEKQPLTGE